MVFPSKKFKLQWKIEVNPDLIVLGEFDGRLAHKRSFDTISLRFIMYFI